MRSITMSKQIRMLSELLVFVEMTDSIRKANGLIKSGRVFIDNLRCANTDLHLVLIHPCTLSIRSLDDLTVTEKGVILDIQ